LVEHHVQERSQNVSFVDSFITVDGAHICTPFRPDLATLIPHARMLEHNGAKLLVIPNGHEEARLARNLGVAIPSPILTRYDWCGLKGIRAPWEIQKTTAALLTESPRAYVLSTMGTGKTRATLFAADFLIKRGRAKKILVSAPLSTLTPVWEDELFGSLPHLRKRVLYGSRAKRLKLLAEDADIYIINHHGLVLLKNELAAKGFDIVVIDELAVLRNKSTEMWKAHSTVIEKAKWAWGLTGSPTPMAPTDAWAQIRMLTPNNTSRTMAQFQDQTMQRISQFRSVARSDANETVHRAMQPSVRFTRDDVMELPPTSYVNREVKLDTAAATAYKMLFDKMRLLTKDGESITAVNEGVLQSKLLQVACGFIYCDVKHSGPDVGTKTVYALPATQRLDALDETIAETDRKVIVFVPFVHALQGVAEHLKRQGHDVALIHGGVSRGRRDMIFSGFQHGTSPRIIVAHPQCMSHGLTLTAANTIVWYSPTQSLEIYEQANARIIRPSQTSKTLIAHLYGTPVERAVYSRLRTRGKMQGLLLSLFRQQELDF
jgi:SNF2 family DNA or RNA helicase